MKLEIRRYRLFATGLSGLTLAALPIFAGASAPQASCLACGTHQVCTAVTNAGASYYNWIPNTGGQIIYSWKYGNQQGNQTVTWACLQAGLGQGLIDPWTANPGDGGSKLSPQQTFSFQCNDPNSQNQ